MFVRKKKNASDPVSIQILEKINRKNKLVKTIGSSKNFYHMEGKRIKTLTLSSKTFIMHLLIALKPFFIR